MDKIISKSLIFILSIIFTSNGNATERFEFYSGSRQLAMGGAGIATVNDETALFINPAGLGKLRDSISTLIDPELHGSANNKEILGNQDITKAFEIGTLKDYLIANPDKHYHFKAQIFPSIVVPNFGFGIFGKHSYDAEYLSETSTYHLDYTNDYALMLGYNFRIWDGRIKFGFNLKFINRTEIHQDFTSPYPDPFNISSVAKEGAGIGTDLGLILAAPWKALPTLAIVGRDMGATRYTAGHGLQFNGVDRPESTPQTVDAAIAFFPIVGKSTRVSFTAEMRDVGNVYNETDTSRRYHTGLEINISDMLFLRGGMNQRYWTGGFEFATPYFQFQFSSYGEDIGTDGSPREDRRVIGKFSVRF